MSLDDKRKQKFVDLVGQLGGTPGENINDLIHTFLVLETGEKGNVNDLWKKVFDDAGIASGHFNERYFEWLGGSGDTLNAREQEYFDEKEIIRDGRLLTDVSFTSADARNLFTSAGLLDIDGAAANEFRRTYPESDLPTAWFDGSAKNSLEHNRDLSNAVWTNNGATQDATGLAGVSNKAWTFSGTDDASQSLAVPNDSNTNRPVWWLKKGGGSAILSAAYTGGTTTLDYIATVDTTAETAAASGDAVAADISVIPIGDQLRVQIDAANNSTGNTSLTYKMDVSAGTFVYDFGGVFLNQTAPLHPFETGASAITLDSEDASLALGSWFKQGQGSITVEFYMPVVTADALRYLAIFYDTDSSSSIHVRLTTTGQVQSTIVTAAGGLQTTLTSSALAAGRHIAMLTYEGDNVALYVDGTQVDTDTTSVNIPTSLNICAIGSFKNSSNYGYAGVHELIYASSVKAQSTGEAETTL